MADDPQKKAQSERAARLQKQIDELVAGNGGRASSNPRAFTDAAAAETKRQAEESPAEAKDLSSARPRSSGWCWHHPSSYVPYVIHVAMWALLGFIFLGGWGALIAGALAAAASLVDVVKHVRSKRR